MKKETPKTDLDEILKTEFEPGFVDKMRKLVVDTMFVVFEELFDSEYSQEFVEKMKNRMLVSYFKYGPVEEGFPDNVNALASLEVRLTKYRETGNTEFLIDAANFAMIEFMHPRHPEAHFKATDSNESPGRMSTTQEEVSQKTNRELLGERLWEETDPAKQDDNDK